MRSRMAVLVGAAASVLAVGGCGDSADNAQTAVTVARQAGADSETGCTPVVMVVRHAEDGPNPAGGADILDPSGLQHAQLYPKLFAQYVAEPHGLGPDGAKVNVCPIGKILAIDPKPNDANGGPGTNPYKTIEPTAASLGLTIQTQDAAGTSYSTVYEWDAARRQALLDGNGTSTVIAWDKQGLFPSADDLKNKSINGKKLGDYGFVPLLEALPADKNAITGGSDGYTPQRTDFYVFAQQSPDTGQFAAAKAYRQSFSDDGGATWYSTDRLGPSNNPDDIKV